MDMPRIEMLERAALNAAPAPRQAWCGAAVVRAGHGGAGRINSATWLDPADGGDLPARVRRIEGWYERLALRPRFRLTPLAPPALEPLLMARGYARMGETIVMVGALDGLPLPDGPVEMAEAPDEAWFEASAGGAVRSGERMAELRLSPWLLLVPAAWVSVRLVARVASVAQVAVDGTIAVLSGVATSPAMRGRGLARRACLAAFGWARSEGARVAWLAVKADNDAALSLYRRLGFRESYRYAYRVRG
jgi:ribosomal protein S18 acetylase RimI-like enzyme